MTVSIETSEVSYNGNGVTTALSVPFKFLEADDLTVEQRTGTGAWETLVEGVDYTVDGEDEDDGGTVTMLVAPPNGDSVRITRNTDITQSSDFQPQGPFPVARHETAADKLTLICQELSRRVEALEALGNLVNVTDLAAATRIGDDVPVVGEIEDAFPLQIACVNGANAQFVLWRIYPDDESVIFPVSPAVQWRKGPGDNITVLAVDGLAAAGEGQPFHIEGLVFFDPNP